MSHLLGKSSSSQFKISLLLELTTQSYIWIYEVQTIKVLLHIL